MLDAALAAGLNLPHSCKSGNCGSCRALLLRGEIGYPFGPPAGLAAAEVAAGHILLCQARARTDLELETTEIRAAHEATVKRLPCRIERTRMLSHDVLAVYLRLPVAEEFRFEAGQYLDVMLPGGRRRSFSIASSPEAIGPLELQVRRVAGGEFTDPLFTADASQRLLQIEGPLGQFVYRPRPAPQPAVMLGGGTGLAPLLSMLRQRVGAGLERPVSLYWGVRSERDLYADDELRELARRSAQLTYVPVLSEPQGDWRGRSGFVHTAALADLASLAGIDIYASGPPAMIEAVRREFGSRGAEPERLFFDSFDYAPDAVARQRSRASTSA